MINRDVYLSAIRFFGCLLLLLQQKLILNHFFYKKLISMKNYISVALFILVSLLFFACEKDTTTTNATNNDDYYITFDFDGTPIEYRSTGYQGSTSSSGYINISGGILKPNLTNFSATESIYVNINMDEDSVTYNELQSLIGQNLEVCFSSSTICNAPVHIGLDFDDGTTVWNADKNNNTAATHYLKINKVDRSSTVPLGFSSLVIIEGEFNLVLDSSSNSSTTKNATNGKFRLQFPEYR